MEVGTQRPKLELFADVVGHIAHQLCPEAVTLSVWSCPDGLDVARPQRLIVHLQLALDHRGMGNNATIFFKQKMHATQGVLPIVFGHAVVVAEGRPQQVADHTDLVSGQLTGWEPPDGGWFAQGSPQALFSPWILSVLVRSGICAKPLGERLTTWHDPVMVEYGNGVGQVAGGSGGRVGGGGADWGGQIVHFVTDSVDKISALPPETLLLIAVVAIIGLVVLKRAF